MARRMGLANPEVVNLGVLHPAEGCFVEVKGTVTTDIRRADLVIPAEGGPALRGRAARRGQGHRTHRRRRHRRRGRAQRRACARSSTSSTAGSRSTGSGTTTWARRCRWASWSTPRMETGAHAILMSTIISHNDVHRTMMRRLAELCQRAGDPRPARPRRRGHPGQPRHGRRDRPRRHLRPRHEGDPRGGRPRQGPARTRPGRRRPGPGPDDDRHPASWRSARPSRRPTASAAICRRVASTTWPRAFAPTSVAAGDVGIGVDQARRASCRRASGLSTAGAEVFVNSSAAGGLRMTVHGLTHGR